MYQIIGGGLKKISQVGKIMELKQLWAYSILL